MYDTLYAWYFDSKRIAEAENILKAKASNNPKQGDYILQLALHYYRVHKLEEMNSTLQRMLDDPKDFPKAQLQAGDFYMKIRNFPEAVRHYQEAERRNPQDSIVFRKADHGRVTGSSEERRSVGSRRTNFEGAAQGRRSPARAG